MAFQKRAGEHQALPDGAKIRLAAGQDRRGRTVTHPAKRALQLGELAGASHHSQTADSSGPTRAADAASAYPHIAVNSTGGA